MSRVTTKDVGEKWSKLAEDIKKLADARIKSGKYITARKNKENKNRD